MKDSIFQYMIARDFLFLKVMSQT